MDLLPPPPPPETDQLMGAVAIGIHTSIGIHMQTHLVSLWVCVEWRAEVSVVELLAFGELHHCELTQ